MAGLGELAQFLRFGRDLAPLSLLNGPRALLHSTAGPSLLLPTALTPSPQEHLSPGNSPHR
ncbi:hypothetical protein [Streptomyces sp. NPDC001652]|uniref:hypothetical protein n=1 Tax=Streptomyces sp. NPDC001652 TaxID=3154393 RepID=UPI003321E12E